MFATAWLLYALAQAAPSQGEPSPAPAAQAQPPAPPAADHLVLPAGTQVEVELVDTVSSVTNHLADRFAIRLAAPISHEGAVLVAPGAPGEGEVIDVARAGMAGRQGKLIIAARYLDLNGRRVRVRGMTLASSGQSHVDLATGALLVPLVGLGAVFIQGGEIQIPAGARATVRLAEDVDLPLAASSEPKGETK